MTSLPLNRYLLAVTMMADIEVLAEDTAEVAGGEKYGSRPAGADKDAFFAEMRPYGTDKRHIRNTAKADLALASVCLAVTRTEHTGIQTLP